MRSSAKRPVSGCRSSALPAELINCRNDTAISMPTSGMFCASARWINPALPLAMPQITPAAPNATSARTIVTCMRDRRGHSNAQAPHAMIPVSQRGKSGIISPKMTSITTVTNSQAASV